LLALISLTFPSPPGLPGEDFSSGLIISIHHYSSV